MFATPCVGLPFPGPSSPPPSPPHFAEPPIRRPGAVAAATGPEPTPMQRLVDSALHFAVGALARVVLGGRDDAYVVDPALSAQVAGALHSAGALWILAKAVCSRLGPCERCWYREVCVRCWYREVCVRVCVRVLVLVTPARVCVPVCGCAWVCVWWMGAGFGDPGPCVSARVWVYVGVCGAWRCGAMLPSDGVHLDVLPCAHTFGGVWGGVFMRDWCDPDVGRGVGEA
jgi:hypothetical protein